MLAYLPWWSGALALSVIVLGFWLSLGRPLGVSGSWSRVVTWKDDRHIDQVEAPFRNNPKMLQDALMKATIEHFGEPAVVAALARHSGSTGVDVSYPTVRKVSAKGSWTMHACFLAMLVIGGLVASLVSGHFQPRFTLGELHAQLFGSGMGYLITLFVGGAMVGFGTQLAGGCTSGHGLSGCSRLVPASLIATGAFFGTAVAVSLLIHYFGGGAA